MKASAYNAQCDRRTEAESSRQGVRALLRDVLELVELQSLLVRTGLRESAGHVKVGSICGGAAAVIALAALLLLMQSAAGFLAAALAVSMATAELIVGGVALFCAVAAAAVAARKIGRTATVAAEASDELAANLRAVKEALAPPQPDSARYKAALQEIERRDN